MTVKSPRRTRSKVTRLISHTGNNIAPTSDVLKHTSIVSEHAGAENRDNSRVERLSSTLTTRLTQLSKRDLQTLLKKRQWLRSFTPSFQDHEGFPIPPQLLSTALDATLVFAQEEAGTAVCISPDGLILTCSHCIAEDEAELPDSRTSWLIFASGQAVKTECVAWDGKRDLALCRVVGAEDRHTASLSQPSTESDLFPYVRMAAAMPRLATRLVCIGHPGSDDLESIVPGAKTNYDTLYISHGRYRGYSPGQDIHANEEIGALRHDCWTYWGHSGAPLIETKTGALMGLHSSWDDTTGMRRGVGLEAIKSFLHENQVALGQSAILESI